MRDIASNIAVRTALAPAVHTAAANGVSIDRKGFESVAFAVNTGAIAGDGDFTFKLQDSDDNAAWADVDTKFVVGSAPASLAATSAAKLGYIGHRRYARVALTKAGGTSIAAGAIAILGDANARPVA